MQISFDWFYMYYMMKLSKMSSRDMLSKMLRCKLLSPCILIPLGAYTLWAFALYDKGLCPVSFCSLCWGLMPCECIYALMLSAHVLDGTTCMIKKLKLHSRVKSLLIRCYPWVAKLLSGFLSWVFDEVLYNDLMMFMLLTVIDKLYA